MATLKKETGSLSATALTVTSSMKRTSLITPTKLSTESASLFLRISELTTVGTPPRNSPPDFGALISSELEKVNQHFIILHHTGIPFKNNATRFNIINVNRNPSFSFDDKQCVKFSITQYHVTHVPSKKMEMRYQGISCKEM